VGLVALVGARRSAAKAPGLAGWEAASERGTHQDVTLIGGRLTPMLFV
jgi:hypothetical protein